MRFCFAFALCTVLGLSHAAHAALDSADAAEEKDLSITRVTPDGTDVPPGRQIVIEFNRPVVPLGRMERTAEELPVTITPKLNCNWRWLDTSSLSCNLNDEDTFAQATVYEMEIKPGIRAEDGAAIAETYRHRFMTERPDVRYSWFNTWKSPGTPVIRVTFNQSVSKESVARHLFITETGHPEKRVPLTVSVDEDDQELPAYLPLPGEKFALSAVDQPARKSDDDARNARGSEARRVWLVTPAQELPADTQMSLWVEPGLLSAYGPEPSAAQREIVQFYTFPEFKFIGVRCKTIADEEVLVAPGAAPAAGQKCNPLGAISLAFSAPVLRSEAKDNLVFTPNLNGGNRQFDPWGEVTDYSSLGQTYRKDGTYDIYLPSVFKAASTYQVSFKQEEKGFFAGVWESILALFGVEKKPVRTLLSDEFGRALPLPETLTFQTDHRKPNYEIIHNEAVLEKDVDSDVPLYVTNLDAISFNYRSVTPEGTKEAGLFEKTPYKAPDLQYAIPFGVREMLGGRSGAVFGHLATKPHVSGKYKQDSRLFAQVTPYQLHVKLGHFSTLAWVVDFATGEPVSDAKLTLYKNSLTALSDPKEILATGVTGKDGVAMLPGTESIDPDLSLSQGWGDERIQIFARVDKDGDMAVMPLSGDFTVDTWRASGETMFDNTHEKYGHLRTWGTTAQGIYRAGDTIQYKFYVRHQDDRTLTPAPKEGYTLHIVDPTGKTVETVKDITLNEFGAYSGEYKTSEQAAVGWYRFRLSNPFDGEKDDDGGEEDSNHQWTPMRVLVSDFTPASFKVTSDLNGDLFTQGRQVEVASAAKLHSGGAYTDANVRVTAILDSRPFASKHPLAQSYAFDSFKNETQSQQLYQAIQPLNEKGEYTASFATGNPNIVYGTLIVESAVQDDRGKYIAAASRADYLGVDRLVGMKGTEWLYEAKKPANINYIVVDAKGNPVAGTPVSILIEREATTASRVKGAGNAYLTNITTEWKKAGDCGGTSENEASICAFTPTEAGTYRLTASIKDTQGRAHSTRYSIWVTGKDYVLWNQDNDSYLPIIPEKPEYRVGDTARYLVKNPYPGAKALITIERYGVIDRFVQTFKDSTPVIEFPVKPDYLPGYYLSVTVISPRVEKPLGEGQVDLGKPTFRMGYLAVPVNDPYKEMKVTAKPEQEVYRPRDTVKVALHAEPRFAADKKEPIELAVAVLDEAVFDLVAGGKTYYDPYKGFYLLDSLDLRNFSLLTRLVGRQKFEKKGANPGGDGGADLALRNLFKFVSYWNPSLKTDENGNADISFEAPDNLTGWRVLAIASTPGDRFGLGDANFKVNRPTEVRPAMPNQVTEGDDFKAGFSVMNRTDKKRTLNVTISAKGLIDSSKTPTEHSEKITLEPYKRATVFMPVETLTIKADRDTPKGSIDFAVRAWDEEDADGMEHHLTIEKRRSLETNAAYGTTEKNQAEASLLFPEKIHTDVGSVSVVASPSVIANVDGAFRYMRDYDYTCWEQRLTRGVMASHYKNLLPYMEKDFWKGSADLPQTMLEMAANFQTPNGGMAYYGGGDDYADPYLSAYTALAFNWLRHSGYRIPAAVEARLHRYLLEMLKRDVTPDFYTEGMSSTVRAVALAALSETGEITREDLERYRAHVPQMSLFGKTHYLRAALNISGGEKIAGDVSRTILSHASQNGGKFTFNETLDDSYSRILATPLRENCAILDTFTAYGETKEGATLVGDVPFKLVRSITQSRGNRDHWENTQENLFCMNALIGFSRIYEKTPPKMKISASLDDISFGEAAFSDVKDKPAIFERPLAAGDPGRKATMTIRREGDGRLYYATRLSFAPLGGYEKPVNAGMELKREYSVERDGKWVLLKDPIQLKRGELVRVDLYLSLPTARNFVVVDDPVPGGLEPVNRDLANASEVDARKADFVAAEGSWWFHYADWSDYNVSRWSFYHQELRHNAARFYSDYLPAGNYHLSYAAQAIAEGEFTIMPVHAEEMYDPDVFAKGVNERLVVK